jgi:hypothetical protein
VPSALGQNTREESTHERRAGSAPRESPSHPRSQRSRGEPLAPTTPALQGRAPRTHDPSAPGESPSQPRHQRSRGEPLAATTPGEPLAATTPAIQRSNAPTTRVPHNDNAPTRKRSNAPGESPSQRQQSVAPGESPSQRREPLTLSVGIERQLSTLAQRQGLSALCPDRLHSRCCSQNGSNPTGMRGRARGASKTSR